MNYEEIEIGKKYQIGNITLKKYSIISRNEKGILVEENIGAGKSKFSFIKNDTFSRIIEENQEVELEETVYQGFGIVVAKKDSKIYCQNSFEEIVCLNGDSILYELEEPSFFGFAKWVLNLFFGLFKKKV